MRKGFGSLGVVLAFLVPVAVSAAPSDIGRRAAEEFIVPGYAHLVDAADEQARALDSLCAAPDQQRLDEARRSFAELMSAWSRIEIIRFGPVLADNRIDRILFWPDRRGIALRQIQGLLADEDETALDPELMRQKSVALQGLGSLEFVLFGTGADGLAETSGYRCALALAISRAIHSTAAEILNGWQAPDGIAHHLADPQPGYADYRTQDEVLSELLGVFIHGFELIRDVRLSPITAFEGNDPNARLALYRRSELTIEAAAANVAGMRDLFVLSGMESALTDDMDWVAGAMDFEFSNFAATAEAVESTPIEAAVSDPDIQSKIQYLRILTQSLQTMAVQQIAVSLGLSAGFSSLDGD